MSFAAGSDEEEYRAFIVENWSLFAKPHKDEEKLVAEDDAETFRGYLAQADTNEELRTELGECLLLRYFAIASKYESEECFKLIVDAMVRHIHMWDKALIVSILLFHRYANGMEILYTHDEIREKRIFDIEDVFDNKGFLHTEGNAKKNTILGIIAYGRLREDLLGMAQIALHLDAEMTKSGEYVRSPLVNAIQSGNYRILSLFAVKNLSAFTYKSPSNAACDALKSAFEQNDSTLLSWISNICQGKSAGLLPDKSPSRPSSSLPVSTDGTEFMKLNQLLEGKFLKPGDAVEAKIEKYLKLANHFMIYVGDCDGRSDAIVHKDGITIFSGKAQNGSVEFDYMTPYDQSNYTQWRRAPLIASHSNALSPILLLTSQTAYTVLSRGLDVVKSTLPTNEDSSTPKPPIDVIFDAIQSIGTCNYDLLRENCEHFANEVKRGVAESGQVKKVMNLCSGLSSVSGSLGEHFGSGGRISGELLCSSAAKMAENNR